jgi:hypothetical protein
MAGYDACIFAAVLVIGICVYKRRAIAKRNIRAYYNTLGLILITTALLSIYAIVKFFDLSSFWPQFFLTLLTIAVISSAVMVAEANTYRYHTSFPCATICCFCPVLFLCLLTVFILINSLVWEETEPSYKAFLGTYGFPCLVWLGKYLVACILISALTSSTFWVLENPPLQIQQVPLITSAQVTEFAVKELEVIVSSASHIGCMAIVYWVYFLVFGDVPGLLSNAFMMQVSCVVGSALSRLLPKDKQHTLNDGDEVLNNSFSAFISLACIASASQLIP